jgi:hypothetical protein
MSGSQHISRRSFLVAALGLAPTILAARFGLGRAAIDDDAATDAQRLVRAFAYPESAAELGRAYLATAPREGSATVLAERIAASLPAGHAAIRTADDSQLESLLAQQLREDFMAGDTVTVDGWIISKTEARLCALAALLT